MKRFIYLVIILSISVSLLSGCSTYKTVYKRPAQGKGYWELIDNKTTKPPELYKDLVLINARKTACGGGSICKDLPSGRKTPAGYLGPKIGGEATAIAYDPEGNKLIAINHIGYEIWQLGDSLSKGIIEAGDIFDSGYIAEVVNPDLRALLTVMYTDPELVASYLKQPTCEVQHDLVNKFNATKKINPTPGLEAAFLVMLSTGYNPGTGKYDKLSRQEMDAKFESLKGKDVIWKEIEEKKYCSLVKTHILNTIDELVFKTFLAGDLQAQDEGKNKKVSITKELNFNTQCFGPKASVVKNERCYAHVFNEPFADMSYTVRDRDLVVNMLASMNQKYPSKQ